MSTMKRLILVLAAVAFLLPATAHAATTTVPATADTSIEEQFPTSTFGSGLLRVDGSPQRWALIEFAVPALAGSVTSAQLQVFKRVGQPAQTVQVQPSPCNWTYNTVTWNTRPTLEPVVATATAPASEGAIAFALPANSVTAGNVCFALTKTAAADVWITLDDLDAPTPAQLVVTTTDAPDSDGDGVPDSADLCPGTPAGTHVDTNGCAVAVPPPPSGQVSDCADAPQVNVTPSTMRSALSNNRIRIVASPGTYSSLSMHKTTTNSCVSIRCSASAKGASYPSWNSGGCLTSGESTIESIKDLTIDGFVIHNSGAETYGLALYDESPHVGMNTRIANSVFAGSNDHDISTKERQSYTEVVNNWFVNCRRHCWEIGQNGNIATRPSTTGTSVFTGNIATSTINVLTQRYNLKLIVQNNDFRSVAGYVVNSWPYWALYPFGASGDNGALYVPGTQRTSDPKVPLRTEITGNRFSTGNRLLFTGRGVINDTVLVQGNTGSAPGCSRGGMNGQNSGTSAAHINEQTTAPPRLDAASDVPC